MVGYYAKLVLCLLVLWLGLRVASWLMRYEGNAKVKVFEWTVTRREIALAITPGARPETVDFEDPIRTYANVRKVLAELQLLSEHPDTIGFMRAYAPAARSPLWVLLDPSYHFVVSESRSDADFLALLGELVAGRHLVSVQAFVVLLNRHRESYTAKRVREDMPSMIRGAVDAVRLFVSGSGELLDKIDVSAYCVKLEVAMAWQDAPSLRAAMLVITERLNRLAKFWVATRGTHVQADLDGEVDHLLGSIADVDDVHFEVRMTLFMTLDTYFILDKIQKSIISL